MIFSNVDELEEMIVIFVLPSYEQVALGGGGAFVFETQYWLFAPEVDNILLLLAIIFTSSVIIKRS
jgi:hypothetical protein